MTSNRGAIYTFPSQSLILSDHHQFFKMLPLWSDIWAPPSFSICCRPLAGKWIQEEKNLGSFAREASKPGPALILWLGNIISSFPTLLLGVWSQIRVFGIWSLILDSNKIIWDYCSTDAKKCWMGSLNVFYSLRVLLEHPLVVMYVCGKLRKVVFEKLPYIPIEFQNIEMWRDESPRYQDHITGPEPPWERPDFRFLLNWFNKKCDKFEIESS